jgi:hypothetical protein
MGGRSGAPWTATERLSLVLGCGMALAMIIATVGTQYFSKGVATAERRILAQSNLQGVASMRSDVIPPVSDVLAVIPTFKRDLEIARMSLLWRRDSVHALFLLPEQDKLTPQQEAALLAENTTVGYYPDYEWMADGKAQHPHENKSDRRFAMAPFLAHKLRPGFKWLVRGCCCAAALLRCSLTSAARRGKKQAYTAGALRRGCSRSHLQQRAFARCPAPTCKPHRTGLPRRR